MAIPSVPRAQKPLLFFASYSGEGHTNPVLAIATFMVRRGYEVVYLCSKDFEEKIKSVGAEFIEIDWAPQLKPREELSRVAEMPPGIERLALQLVIIFYKAMSIRARVIAETLEKLKARDPSRQIIYVEDILNMGAMPFRYSCSLPAGFDNPPKTIGISPIPLLIQSRDTAPVPLGLSPDSTDSGRARNQALWKLAIEGPLRPLTDAWLQALKECGCATIPSGNPMNGWYTAHDATVMLCSPSLEYSLSDMPSTVHFAGCLPRGKVSPSYEYPDWWPEVIAHGRGSQSSKRVIFVCQGTVNLDWRELVIPTLRAFADRRDILIVAALGSRGARLEDDVDIPSNARVIDYLPYDAVLPLAHIFISNGGYGGLQHAVMNGTATVFAGETEEKAEVGMRGAWAGFAVNLKTQTPTTDKLRAAVAEILGNERYLKRASELQAENEALDCLSRIKELIEILTE
ncbi:hypothetical protein HIM_08795 [Hirsutella minnesotensis 3608]|uniref:Erythromycin biosynthesis protein CIII-like C-terminal domain-containing protein n=1 Tax=Hirsutella minnesotensis 3608 TaxID=1043627 RepID=A0A0F8A3H2_9HYPO|nr:hypothetical protein HIM_08795 [Hirsutella minnesotensis 3608]